MDEPRLKTRLPHLALLCGVLSILVACGGSTHRMMPAGGWTVAAEAQENRVHVVTTARRLIGVRYLYGGATPERGFDCSGLVYYSHGAAGVSVPRTSAQQLRRSLPVSLSSLLPGDLVFFEITEKQGHVGIYAGEGRFIHAPSRGGRVRVEHIDNPYWRQRLLGGGTFLGG